jgi:hypothetical protein
MTQRYQNSLSTNYVPFKTVEIVLKPKHQLKGLDSHWSELFIISAIMPFGTYHLITPMGHRSESLVHHDNPKPCHAMTTDTALRDWTYKSRDLEQYDSSAPRVLVEDLRENDLGAGCSSDFSVMGR